MSLPVRLRRVAQHEYDAAVDWYEARRAGLGLRFVHAVQRMLADISRQPDHWPEALSGVREAPLRRWPYAIYYQIHADHVLVLAVFHLARDPQVWQSRI